MANKRTYINADEELIIQGKLTIEGNVVQKQYVNTLTFTENKFEGDVLVINSDGVNANGTSTTGQLTLRSGTTDGTLQFSDSNTTLVVSHDVKAPTFLGNIHMPVARNFSISGDGSATPQPFDGTGDIDLPLVLATVNTDVGSWGDASTVPTFTVNGKGLITGASENAISITSGNITDFVTAVRGNVSHADAGGDGSFSYDSATGVFTYTGPSLAEVQARIDNSAANVRAHISVTDAGGDGSLSYSSSTGVITYTGPSLAEVQARIDNSAANVRAHFSASNGVDYNSATGAFQAVETEIQHDSLDGFVANEHIDHSGVDIIAGNGLVGGGDITASRTLNVVGGDGITANADDIEVDSTVVRTSGNQTIAGDKTFTGTVDLSGASVPGFTIDGELSVTGNVNSLNYVDLQVQNSEIILNSNVATAQDAIIKNERGSTGTDTYLKWDEGSTRWQFSNDGSTDNNMLLLTDFSATGNITYNNTTGVIGQSLTTDDVTEGTNLYYTTARAQTDAQAVSINNVVEDTTPQLGGTLDLNGQTIQGDLLPSANITYDLGSSSARWNDLYLNGSTLYLGDDVLSIAGGKLQFNSSNVVVSGENLDIAGTQTFTGELVIPATSATANGAIYYDNVTGEAYIYVSGMAKKITPAVDAGDVEGVGASGIGVYAGTRVSGNVTYHGIKSLNSGTYTGISESANVITIDGNATAIRGLVSSNDAGGDGSFSYNSSTGVFTYTGPSATEVRSHFSAGTGINIAGGVISSTVAGFTGFDLTTDSGAGSAHTVNSGENVTLQGGTNITVTNTGNVITIRNDNAADIESVTAGSGLTGGGNSGALTLNIGAGTGITVNPDNVAVDMSAFSTTDLTEGTNLYYTDTRADARVDAGFSSKDTDDLSEGSNLYYTDARARAAVSATGDLSYNASTGVFSFTERTDAEVRGLISATGNINYNSTTGVISESLTTTDIDEGDNLYYTDARARGAISVSGDLSYDSATGVISFTNDAGDIESVGAGSGLTGGGTSGAVTLNVGAGAGITVNADNIALTSGVVTASTKGSASKTVTATVDTYGRVTALSDQDIAITSGQVSGLASSATTDTTNATNISSGTLASARLPDLTVADFGAAAIQTGAESFSDSDSILMTAAAVQDKIESYGYSTTTGDITEVGAGTNLNGGGTSGSVTLNLDTTLTGMTAATFSGTVTANLFSGTATSARYADLAEKYESDGNYEAGTVVVFGGEAEITITDQENDHRVAGIISTDPAYMMNSEADGQYVALRGRVPCKVIGPVKKGDVLITSNRPGFAMASDQPHFVSASCIVGKALQSLDSPTEGVIEVVV